MRGIHFPHLNKITRDIWQWCEKRDIWVFATYIKYKENYDADFESRKLYSNTEFELTEKTYSQICITFGKPEIDLFASRANAKCKKFVSWHRDPDSFAIDAFTISWREFFFYAFPPFSMILKTLQKIKNDKAVGIMIIPNWSSQPWYPLFRELLISDTMKLDAKNHIIYSRSHSETFWSKITLVVGILSAKRCS